MQNDNTPNDKVSFRQESVDYFFTGGGKPFEVQSPPNFTTYTISALAFLMFSILSLHFIELPTNVKAKGEILAGKSYYQIAVPNAGLNLVDIFVSEGDMVKRGQPLMRLKESDENNHEANIEDINTQIVSLKTLLLELDKNHAKAQENIKLQVEDKDRIITQTDKTLTSEYKTLDRYTESVKSGLVAMQYEENQKRVVNTLKTTLIREEAKLNIIAMTMANAEDNYTREKKTNEANLHRLIIKQKQRVSGNILVSPCDCLVDNVLAEINTPVELGRSVLTLSKAIEQSEAILYIPASEYRSIKSGLNIQLNIESYPSAKFGKTKATITSVSPSPVPGDMLNNSLGLGDTSYFVIKAVVMDSPEGVVIATGMTINSDIAIGENTLLSLIVPTEHAH